MPRARRPAALLVALFLLLPLHATIRVHVADQPGPAEPYVVRELRHHLGALKGEEIAVVPAADQAQILLFTGSNLPAGLRDTLAPLPAAPEEFVLKNVTYAGANRVVVCGADARGELYGAYELIEAVMARALGTPWVDIAFEFEPGCARGVDLTQLGLEVRRKPFYRNRGLHLDFVGLGTASLLGKDKTQPRDREVWLRWSDWCARHRLNFMTNWPYGKTNWWELVPGDVLPGATRFSEREIAEGIAARRQLLALSAERGVAPYLMNYVPGRGTQDMVANFPGLFTYSTDSNREVARFCYNRKELWDSFTRVAAEVVRANPEMAGFNLRRWGESYPCECDFCRGRDPELSRGLLEKMMDSATAARPGIKLLLSGRAEPDYAANFPDHVTCMIKWGDDWDPSPDTGRTTEYLAKFGRKDVIIDIALPCEESFPIGLVEHTYLDAGIKGHAARQAEQPNLTGFCAGFGDSDFGFITELNFIVFSRLVRDPLGFDTQAFCRAYLANKFGEPAAGPLLDSLNLQADIWNKFYCSEARGGYEFLHLAPYSNWARFGDLYESFPRQGRKALDWTLERTTAQLETSRERMAGLLAGQRRAHAVVASLGGSVRGGGRAAFADFLLQTEASLRFLESRSALIDAVLARHGGDTARWLALLPEVRKANEGLLAALKAKANNVGYGDQGGNIADWELKRLREGIEGENDRLRALLRERR